MSRNRATLTSLIACFAIAVAATAPVNSRGGPASEMHAAVSSEAVVFTSTIDDTFVAMDADIAAAERQIEADKLNTIVYLNAVHQADLERVAAEQAAAERAAAEAARAEAQRRTAAATPPPAPERQASSGGACGGWAALIAAYFPGEERKACSVMLCESGGSTTIHNASSSASGLWQFLDSTWRTVTGTAGPASNYSAETQTAAAAKLRHSGGWGAWSCS